MFPLWPRLLPTFALIAKKSVASMLIIIRSARRVPNPARPVLKSAKKSQPDFLRCPVKQMPRKANSGSFFLRIPRSRHLVSMKSSLLAGSGLAIAIQRISRCSSCRSTGIAKSKRSGWVASSRSASGKFGQRLVMKRCPKSELRTRWENSSGAT